MQIVLFLLLVLAVLIVLASKKDTLSTSMKVYILLSLVLVVALGWLYNIYNNNNASHDRELVNIFEQGHDIKCGDYVVNNKSFVFVSGTLSFVAKDDQKSLRGVVLDISTCKKTK